MDSPWMEAGWWACRMHLEARILPHLLQGFFSPQCTPMCFISLWWLGSSFSHTGHTMASLAVPLQAAGMLWHLCHLAWALAPSGRSFPLRRDYTCCFTLLRAHFLTITSPSPTGVGTALLGCPTLAAWPLHATPASGPSPSASSSDERPTSPLSSVSKGCSFLYQDTIKGEVSRTSLTLSSSATTEMEKWLLMQLEKQGEN